MTAHSVHRSWILQTVVGLLLSTTQTLADLLDDSGPIVHTTKGPVLGATVQFGGHSVDIFKGIPFAAPPLGDLRFSPPQPAKAWSDVRNGTYFRASCMQKLANQHVSGDDSEDCLFVNVFRPKSNETKLPVLFWIYGGGYHDGSANLYDFSLMAAMGGIVVVTTNYRLGAFGFLYTRSQRSTWKRRTA